MHNVFVSFAQSATKLRLRGDLKSYLSTAVANNARNLSRNNAKLTSDTNTAEVADSISNQPDRLAISIEDSQCVGDVLEQLPYQQREVIILHLQGGLKFREIAKSQNVSVNTIQSRYRYGLNKMRSILDGEVEK